MTPEKSRPRPARRHFLKSDVRQATRKAHTSARRQRPGKAGQYDQHAYDGTDRTEASEES